MGNLLHFSILKKKNLIWLAIITTAMLVIIPTIQVALAGTAGYALSFDGSNDLVKLTETRLIMAPTWTSTKTVEVWVKPEGLAVTCANSAVFACDRIFGDKPEWWGITRGIINGQDRIWIANFDGNLDAIAVTYNPDEWVHIVLVHDGGMLRAYKNGIEVGSRASGSTVQPAGVYSTLYIGGTIYSLSRNYTFQGDIDEVRIWNTARSAADIQANMLHELVGDEAGLAAYYRMSDGVGLTLTDDSVNNWNGTLMDGCCGVPPDGFPPLWVSSDAFGPSDPTPTFTPEPPTATPEPPTVTPEPPTATPEPPTVTPEPPTVTPEPPTVTPEPATATPEPPTATPEPPTATPEPPTATPEPPTATPEAPTPTNTFTPEPPTPTPTSTPANGAGYALSFDGSNDLVKLTETRLIMATTWTSTKTIELWVKPEGSAATCANSAVFACDYIFGDKPEWWGITRGIINGQDRIWIANWDGNGDIIGVTYTPGVWVHIAMVHNAGVLRAYKNGIEVGSRLSGPTRQPSTGAPPILYIGGVIFNVSRNYTLQGDIDEVRIWNVARSAADIQANMLHELVGDEAGLAAYYRMSDGVGLTLTDDSVNNWNGTLMDGCCGVPPDGFPPLWISSDAF